MTSGTPDPSKLNPLSDHARGVLESIARAPVASLEINAGVWDRLYRERLIEGVELKSPFKSHAGKSILHAKITDAGLAKLGLPTPKTKRKR